MDLMLSEASPCDIAGLVPVSCLYSVISTPSICPILLASLAPRASGCIWFNMFVYHLGG